MITSGATASSTFVAGRAGQQIGALCRRMYEEQGQIAVRRIQGVLALAKKYGPVMIEEEHVCDSGDDGYPKGRSKEQSPTN